MLSSVQLPPRQTIMLLTASPNFDSCDVQIAPLQEVDVCCRLQEGDEPTSTTDTSTTSGVAADTTTHTSSATGLPLRLPLHYYHLTSTTHLARTFGGNRRRLDSDDGDPCSQDSEGLKKKRKFEDTVDDDDGAVQKVDTCRRLLISRKGLLDAGKGDNIPLFYLYGDLLLIPKFKWVSQLLCLCTQCWQFDRVVLSECIHIFSKEIFRLVVSVHAHTNSKVA